MPMKAINMRVDSLVWSALNHATPKGYSSSSWVRTLVETLVARPESSQARGILKRLVEDPLRGGSRDLRASEKFRVTFRVKAEYWSALDSLAQAAGLKRIDYMRRMLYAGCMFKGEWFPVWLREEAEGELQE